MRLISASDDVEASKRVMRQVTEMERQEDELEAKLTEAEEPPPLLHPNLAEVYRERLDSLSRALGRPDTREEAADLIRSLASAIELTPENGDLAIVLRGDLAAMLSFAANKKKPGAPSRETGLSESLLSQASSVAGTRSTRWLRGSDPQGSLVAGVGFEPTTFRL
jgi:site-specific DNA recombinase